MKKLAIILAVLLCASPAWAAITSIATLGNANSVVSGTSLVITTSATAEVGNCIVVYIANDNIGASDGDNNDVTGVVDSTGANTYSQLGTEYTYAEGGAGNGANVAAFGTRVASELATGGTITITLGTVTSKVALAWEYGCGAALQVVPATQQTENADGADYGSLAISGLTSQEYMCTRVMGRERDSTTNLTETVGWTRLGDFLASTAVDATSMRLDVEQLIFTGTGCTSDPTFPTPGSQDGASTLLALRDVIAATTRPIAPFIFQ